MSIITDSIGVVIGSFVGVTTIVIGMKSYNYGKKHDVQVDTASKTKEEIAEAVALSNAVNDITWIKEQLGEKPNGGGAMEQILANQRISQNNQEAMQKMIISLSDSIRSHLTWHVARDK